MAAIPSVEKRWKSVGTDRISDLPDSVSGQILSYLPAKDAVATSILSKQWINLFAFTDKFDIDDGVLIGRREFSNSLKDFVDKLLINRTLSLDTLILRCNFDEGLSFGDTKVISWVSAALRLNVRFLKLHIRTIYRLSPLFTTLHGCTSLLSLDLGTHVSKLCLPDRFSLPSLKCLTLRGFTLDAHKINEFMDGCPVLEALCMCQCCFNNANTTIYIRSHFLKRFSMHHCRGDICLRPDLPNLRELSIDDHDLDIQVVSDFMSLDAAHVDCINSNSKDIDVARLTIACSSTLQLYLGCSTIDALHQASIDLPMFQNLTWLKLGYLHEKSGWEILLRLLSNAPNLEKLVFEKGYRKWSFHGADIECSFLTLPIGLELLLKEIDFLEFNGDEGEFKLIEYFLKNGKVLQKLKIHCVPINNSCILDRLHRLSMEPNVFITFSCWKDERLLKCISSHSLSEFLESKPSLAMMNLSVSELLESKRKLTTMNLSDLSTSESNFLELEEHLIMMNQKMIEMMNTLMQHGILPAQPPSQPLPANN